MVLYSPSLARLIEQAELGLDVLASVDSTTFSRPLGALAVEALWGSAYQLPAAAMAGSRFDPRRFLTPEGLREAGIDPAAPVVLIPNPRADVVVIRFGLSDRRTFEGWLDRIGGPDRRRLALGPESASVLALDSERPITCITRHKHALCQLGVSEGDYPVADLARIVLLANVPTYARLTGVVSAFRRLPADAVLYAFINPAALARDAVQVHAVRERRRTRFADARTRTASEEQIRQLSARFAKWARWSDGGAVALITGDRIGMQVELTASALGQRLLTESLPSRTTDDMIGRWAETPALISVLVHADPTFVQHTAQSLGVELPKDALTGTIGFLGLGLDSECPSAKQSAARNLGWAFLLPSALNVGIAGPTAADLLHRVLAQRLPTPPSVKTPWVRDARPPLAGLAAGSPYEIHILDRMMIVGTGVGSGGAALRRLASLKPEAGTPSPAPFLRASLHPRAIDAAFAAGAFGRDHRRELLAIESLRLQLKPLLERVDAITLEANATPDRQHVSVGVDVK